MTFTIITLGCKVNIYESEMMRERLEKAGYHYQKENPDITIINTCSVTNMADKKSEKMVRQAKKNNPHTILIVAGCSSENKRIKYQDFDIDILLGNKDKSKIVDLLKKWEQTKQKITQFYSTRELPFENMTIEEFHSHTRAFLKIQDGCNNFCSYCIIPYVRGTARSKDFQETLKEAKKIAQKHKEIVLTGIHTGHYGADLGAYHFSNLLEDIVKIPGLERLRISSIEITEIEEDVLQVLKKSKIIVDHLHIPLQSGSNIILKSMNRKYDKEYFMNKVNEIRAIRPNISLTTDLIVGFPGETEELFQETVETINTIRFSKIHVFPFSLRKGTKAEEIPNHIDEKAKKERVKVMMEISKKLEVEYMEKFLNQNIIFIPEKYQDGYLIGHTGNYLLIKALGKEDDIHKNIEVKINSIDYPYCIGEKSS